MLLSAPAPERVAPAAGAAPGPAAPTALAPGPRPVSAPERVLQRLDWQVVRRLDGLLQGDYRSLFRGSGLDLASLREYEPGDDVRRIDWNVTARTTTPHVREYHEDREITAWFLLDLSPSVDFGTVEDGRVKRSAAGRLHRDPGAAPHPARQPRRRDVLRGRGGPDDPGGGRPGRRCSASSRDLMAEPHLDRAPVTDLAALFEAAHRQIRRRSMVVIVSDFISTPGWEKPLHLLNRRHEVLAVRLVDPREAALPDVGPIVVQDAETGEQLIVDTHDAKFRARFAEAAATRDADLARAFGRAGVDAVTLSTDEDLVRAIVRMAARRKRRRRGRA